MALYEDLIPDIRGDVHQAPDFVILKALQAVGAEFFTRTGAWEQRIDDIALADGDADYTLSSAAGTSVVRVINVWRDSVALTQQPQRELLRRNSIEGLPTRFSVNGDELSVSPVPGENEQGSVLRVLAALAPTNEATGIPDALLAKWRDALIFGTKARLMESPTQPWSNLGVSAHFRDLYTRELRRAKSAAINGNGAPLKVQPQRFV